MVGEDKALETFARLAEGSGCVRCCGLAALWLLSSRRKALTLLTALPCVCCDA